MKYIIPDIKQALKGNSDLMALLGKDVDGNDRIYDDVAPYAKEYPRLTMFEVVNIDGPDYADDKCLNDQIVVQINVWAKSASSRAEIAQEIDKTMKEHEWSRGSAPDFYDDDIEVYHKAMRYRKKN